MDISRKKQILNNYRHLEQELQEKLNNYKEARSKLSGVGSQIMDDMPKGSRLTFDKIGEGLARLEDLEIIYNKAINERLRIEKAIEGVEDALLRRILIFRYMERISFEQISVNIGYSWRQTHRLHSNALRIIQF